MSDSKYLSFEEAREYVRSLKLSGLKGWIAYCKSGEKPANIPSNAHLKYKNEWQGYGDCTGSGNKRHTKFLSFEEARKFARSLDIFTIQSWNKFVRSDKRPANIPANPWRTYKKEWKGMKNWLRESDESFTEHLVDVETEMGDHIDKAINKIGRNGKLPFEEARKFARGLGLKGQKDWNKFSSSDKRPKNIPATPQHFYDEWIKYADWLGTKRIRQTKFLPFEEAREYAHSLNLRSRKEWIQFASSDKKKLGIPTNPNFTYGNTGEWIGWGDWLGYDKWRI